MSKNLRYVEFVFHKETNAPSDGAELSIRANMVTLVLEITGDATTSKILFEGKGLSNGEFYPIAGVDMNTLDVITETEELDKLVQFNLKGLIKFRAVIETVDGGTVSIKGGVTD